MKKYTRCWLWAAWIVPFFALGGAVAQTPAPNQPQALTLAIAELPVFSVALVAEDQGYFAAQGLALKVIHCVNGKRCLQHLTDGQAQYATVADTPLVLAALNGAKFEILATIAGSARNNQFWARTDRGIRSVADLKGKRIGIVKGTTGHYFADALLLLHGISAGQVTLVPLEGADPAGPLIRGEVDAASLYNPYGARAQAALPQSLIKIAGPSTFNITANLVGIARAAGGKEDDAIKILRALQRAHQLIQSDPAKAKAIVGARLRIAPAELELDWKDYDFFLSLGQPLVVSLEAQSRWALREAMVPGAKMPNYLDYINTAPLRAVQPRAVTLVK